MAAVLLPLSLLSAIFYTVAAAPETRKCEEINIPMCRGIGYNSTAMPNVFQHDSQEEAGLEVHQFWPLVEIQCSEDLRFFLCSMYTPICIDDYPKPLPACSSVCKRAQTGCAPIMSQYGFSWPDRMNCDELPKFGDPNNLCMDSKNGEAPSQPSPTLLDRYSPVVPLVTTKTTGKEVKISKPTKGRDASRKSKPQPATSFEESCHCECRSPLIKLEEMADRRHFNRVETGGIANCAQSCHSMFFSRSEQQEAVQIIVIFAFACFGCTLFTVATCMLDSERFKYPERSIIFICGCYLMVSIGFIIRWWFGHESIACDGHLIRYPGTGPGPTNCLIVFLLIFFFSMAACVWWVILCFTWFLAAGLKWGSEAISGYSQYFHLLAFLIPTAKCLMILGMGAVDGDPFTGICFVGNMDLENMRRFVLMPLTAYLALGGAFLVAGFISLFRVRKVIRQRSKADKLEKLMIRIVIFSVLYAVPGAAVITSYYSELHHRQQWERSITCPCIISADKPVYWFFLLKYIGSLVVGITSGFWIWSPKTLSSWCRFLGRIFCGTRATIASRSTGSQFMGSQHMSVTGYQRQAYKQIPIAQQVAYSSTSHIESITNPNCGVLMKQIPMSHV